jgi:hypothetical protein
MTRPSLGHAIACPSFLRRSIAPLNAFIIPSYIMSLSRNVPANIDPSLIGKRAFRSSRANCFRLSNCGANSKTTFSNPFCPCGQVSCWQFAYSSSIPIPKNTGGRWSRHLPVLISSGCLQLVACIFISISNAHSCEDIEKRLEIVPVCVAFSLKHLDRYKLHSASPVTRSTRETV